MPDERAPDARICTPVCVADARELLASVERAAPDADVIELRLDCLEEAQVEAACDAIETLLQAHTRNFILTRRPSEQGGRRPLSLSRRAGFWKQMCERASLRAVELQPRLAFDLELDLLEARTEPLTEELLSAVTIICSYHDFERVPHDLTEIYERMKRTPARVFKIAVQARDAAECLPLLRLLERARREERELIAVAMGEAGSWTRIIAPARGSFLTYGALDAVQATAPGQMLAGDLRRVFRVHEIEAGWLVTGIVGSPVGHSLSPYMHNRAFALSGIEGVYLPFAVRELEEFMRRMVHPRTRELKWNLRGLSVTAPHKSAVMKHLDWVEPKSLEIGAVNTVVVDDRGALKGYNTDAEASLAPLQGVAQLRGARVAVIGAGGAARAVLWALRSRGAQTTLFARNPERAHQTARDFDARTATLEGVSFHEYEIVINTTPLGTRGAHEDETPAHAAQLRGVRLAYDLVYNPAATRFLREAREAGCETAGGLPMLVAQAAAQFKLWTNMEAPVAEMREAATRRLEEQSD